MCSVAVHNKTFRHEGGSIKEVEKRDLFDSICCLLGLHVGLPRCLHLWHYPLPLRLFVGGARPDADSPPGSNALGPHHHLQAIALQNI